MKDPKKLKDIESVGGPDLTKLLPATTIGDKDRFWIKVKGKDRSILGTFIKGMFATAHQGEAADEALSKKGGVMTGDIKMSGKQKVDGRDISEDGKKLDRIEAQADITTAAKVRAAGALMADEIKLEVVGDNLYFTGSSGKRTKIV
jgi:hypothetical protein